MLNILCAALIDQKLLFYSCSYIRLTEACNALTALMYPFKYRLVKGFELFTNFTRLHYYASAAVKLCIFFMK